MPVLCRHPLIVDRAGLHVWPSATGPQHDERKSFAAKLPGWVSRLLRMVGLYEKANWTPLVRRIPRNAPLHPSVLDRFAEPAPGVLHYDVTQLYRPEGLRLHRDTHTFYAAAPPPAET